MRSWHTFGIPSPPFQVEPWWQKLPNYQIHWLMSKHIWASIFIFKTWYYDNNSNYPRTLLKQVDDIFQILKILWYFHDWKSSCPFSRINRCCGKEPWVKEFSFCGTLSGCHLHLLLLRLTSTPQTEGNVASEANSKSIPEHCRSLPIKSRIKLIIRDYIITLCHDAMMS